MLKDLIKDVNFAMQSDPAARSKLEVLLTYSGVHALSSHRKANFFYRHHLKLLARIISQMSRFFTGIEIHPGAKISSGVFIDHGYGVVIGETAIIEEGVIIYQGATLGGTGHEQHDRRHPYVKSGAVISCGAKVLGKITIGKNAKVGAQSVVLKDVPDGATVVGVPAKTVKINGEKIKNESV